MKNRKVGILAFLIGLMLILPFSGCSQKKTAVAAITPPQATVSDPYVGEWTGTDHDLTINRYIYESGNSIVVIKDVEQEYWCYAGTWSLSNSKKTMLIDKIHAYKYDDSSASWIKENTSSSMELTNLVMGKENNSFTCIEELPNQENLTFSFERGSSDLEVPDMQGLSSYIIDYMK